MTNVEHDVFFVHLLLCRSYEHVSPKLQASLRESSSSSRPFNMVRLPYVHRSQKNIRAPPGLPRQDFQAHTKKQNMCKGIKSKEKVAVMGPLSSLRCDYKIMPSISIKFGGGKIFSLHKWRRKARKAFVLSTLLWRYIWRSSPPEGSAT